MRFKSNMKKYDLILDKEGMISMFQGFSRSKRIIVHPKYVPNKNGSWKIFNHFFDRVSNPFDQKRTNKKEYKLLEKFGKKDYSILNKNIKNVYVSQEGAKNLVEEKRSNTKIRNIAKKLLIQLSKYVPKEDIGITGSILLNSQKDNFSDIDLVINSRSYKKFKKFVFDSKNLLINLRDKNQWEKFYEEYKVVCALSKEDFAMHQVLKPDQFFFKGIPVSTFFVDPISIYLEEEFEEDPNFKARGLIIQSKKSMILPAEYSFLSRGFKKFKIICFNRAYLNQATFGDIVEINGFLKNRTIYIRPNNEDYIKNDKASST